MINLISNLISASVYIHKLLIVYGSQFFLVGGCEGGGGAGNLWDLQFNLLRLFPVGRAADCG